MEIGETQKVETNVPRPVRAPLIPVPYKTPVREPVPAGVPERKNVYVEELLAECPYDGRPLEIYHGEEYRALVCPKHGVIQEI